MTAGTGSASPSGSFRKRFVLGLLGVTLLISGTILTCGFAYQEYLDFYVMPRDKGDTLFPRRWQDIVALVGIWTILISWLWSGYWLLKRALRTDKSPAKYR